MASIRLYASQIQYLRSKAGVLTLKSALARYNAGILVTEKRDFIKKRERLLPYSLHQNLAESPELVRAVLFASMRNPVNHKREIQAVGDEIDSWFNSLSEVQFIKDERGE